MDGGIVLGLLGLGLGVFNTFKTNLPPPNSPNTQLSVAVALSFPLHHTTPGSYNDWQGFGGDLDVRLYNRFGELLGHPQFDKFINIGNSNYQISYEHYEMLQGQQAGYGLFTGNRNNICIAWVAITWADGTKYVVSGDWAHENLCGDARWAYSSLILGHGDRKELYMPKCIWIGRGGSDRTGTSAFQVFWEDLAQRPDGSLPEAERVCDSPSWTTYTDPDHKKLRHHLVAYPIGMDDHVRERSLESANATELATRPPHDLQTGPPLKQSVLSTDDRLIITPWPQHRASELCQSPNSDGPSLVAHSEGAFCDMTTRTLYPLCGRGFGEHSQCFNHTTLSVEHADVTGRVLTKRTKQLAFSDILDWTKDDAASQ